MLNLTASQAVAFRRLADSGFTPEGTLIYLAVADEEALGTWGANWLVDHEWDAVAADYVLTESGGFQMPSPDGPRLPVMVAEKGTFWSKLHVHGTPGHGSQPYGTDNALVTAAEVVRRLAEFRADGPASARCGAGTWRPWTTRPSCATRSWTRARSPTICASLPLGMGRLVHACTHTTFAPNDRARWYEDERHPRPRRARGRHPHAAGSERRRHPRPAARSPRRPVRRASRSSPTRTCRPRRRSTRRCGTPSRRCRHRLVEGLRAGAVPHGRRHRQPVLPPGRRAIGYGFGLFSQRLAFEDYATMFHGNDERVDVESLALSEQLWQAVARELLG